MITEGGDILLDKADQTLLLGELNQLLVVLDLLRSGLGDQHVVTLVQSLGSDGEVGRVRGEDDDGGSLGESGQCRLVCRGQLLLKSSSRVPMELDVQASASRMLVSGNPRKVRSSPL